MTEYASELSRLANDDGGNIAILTDFDDSGITISLQVPNVPRIGIDFNTLEDLGISDKLEELEELYKPRNHLTHIKNKHPEIRNLEYLEEKRIEINAVRNYVGSERFWKWIVSKLRELFPVRDYNRAIDIPHASDFRPKELIQLTDIIDTKNSGVLTPIAEEYEERLSHYQGFIDDITWYENELYDRLLNKINKDGDISPIIKDISNIVRRYNGNAEV